MGQRILFGLVVLVLLAGLAAWAPWISADLAKRRAEEAFTGAWQGVVDGCGFNCQGCGVKEPEKVLFGYTVPLEYACGMLPADAPEYHRTARVYISFLGTVHGFDRP